MYKSHKNCIRSPYLMLPTFQGDIPTPQCFCLTAIYGLTSTYSSSSKNFKSHYCWIQQHPRILSGITCFNRIKNLNWYMVPHTNSFLLNLLPIYRPYILIEFLRTLKYFVHRIILKQQARVHWKQSIVLTTNQSSFISKTTRNWSIVCLVNKIKVEDDEE